MENALNKGPKGIWIGVDLGTTNSTGEFLAHIFITKIRWSMHS